MGFSLTNLAEEDVTRIYIDGFHQFGETQADRYQQGLDEAFTLLGRYPQATRRVPELAPNVRVYSYRWHMILYEPHGLDVRILRVRSSHEDWQAGPALTPSPPVANP